MRLFVIGATGRTGVELLDLALPRHEVTAFVRSPEKITRLDPRLTVVKGSVRRADEVAAALLDTTRSFQRSARRSHRRFAERH